MNSPRPSTAPIPASDLDIVRSVWPVMLAAIVGLFPFTVFSIFVVPIAQSTGAAESLVGALRGLGGVAALVTGVALAPLVARWAAPRTTAASLGFLSVTSVLATLGTLPALVFFCIGIGIATAALTPAVLTIATRSFAERGDSGRAATIVTATQSLAAVLAAPVIGVLALLQGWRGVLWVTAGLAALLAVLFLLRRERGDENPAAALRYLDAFRLLRRRGDLLAVIGIAFLRTTSFMGYLAFLAVRYHDQFEMDAVGFTLVWTLSGASFFAGNFLAGRWARVPGRRRVLLVAGCLGGTVATVGVFTAGILPVALAATAVMGFAHAVVAATLTTLIADRGGVLTTPAYSVSAAGMSTGVFMGAVLGGAGLGVGGGTGLAIALAIPTVLALFLIPAATREAR